MTAADKHCSERIVVGSSIAALVAADVLATAGEQVRVLVDHQPIGGRFQSLDVDGRRLELGAQLLDLNFDPAAPTPPLNTCEPGPGSDRPYARLIADYVRTLVGERLVELDYPQMYLNGRVVDDIFLTAEVTALRGALPPEDRFAIRSEAIACWHGMGDPAGLLAADTLRRLDRMSLDDASFVNHGQTFHRIFVEPIADKLLPLGCAEVIAAHHSEFWLPLFWPETLARAAGDDIVPGDGRLSFHSVAIGAGFYSCAGLIDALLHRLNEHGAIIERAGALDEIESLEDGRCRLTMSGGDVIDAVSPVIGVPAAELFSALGVQYQPATVRSVIAWIEVAATDLLLRPSLLNVVDADVPAVRVSAGGAGASERVVFTVELRHDTAEDEIFAAARKSLEHVGILRAGADVTDLHRTVRAEQPLPTFENAQRFAICSTAVTYANLDAEIVGEAVYFGADSIGEQIVEGLRAADAAGR